MTTPVRVGTQRDILGESPIWDERSQCLYWIDIRLPAIRRLGVPGGRVETWPMPDLVGCIAFVDDGRLLVALPQQVALFDPATGSVGAERVFATTEPPGFPDGSTVDAEGCLWNAQFNAGRVVRYAPDGRIDRVIELPVERPTCCAFGGPGLDILYVTTASQKMTEAELQAQPLAGALLALDVGVRGLVEPRFRLRTLNRSPAESTHAP